MRELDAWLAPRLELVPSSLRERIVHALAVGAESTSIPAALQQAASRLLDQAKHGPPVVDTALTLLAADALITYSCEAIAEGDPTGLSDLP